ncbi:ferric-rhodotorulic acid/ferric-coprogen receptor FhuE [Azoarcus olearius]|uniref:Probable TonB-dependent receptor n=1 Tax=Azoarcus sp. (strain BH72) TaxID=418699 RepID=A1K9V5_AZOSB|nr:ferric-rhodotorulic acid/ferric-coprogen receptor FhuE [Azoarcus olearius]CAL95610.1 probable TonB-dependent receptor [Azoarcus olearius]
MPRFVPPPNPIPNPALTPLALALPLICTPILTTPALAQSTTPEAPRILQPVTVSADTTAAPDPATEGTGSYTTRVTRSATRLDLSIRDTPQSVSVVTRERIDDQGLQSITDVVAATTGVSTKVNDSSRSSFSARGFAIDNLQIDGIPTTWSTGWSAGETLTDTAIYDRVEIVRGATGLMTGAGNPSAAINLVRKHADSTVFTGAVTLGAGSWDNYFGTVDLTAPLNASGSVRARVVGSLQDQDSYVDLYHNRRETLYGVVDADLGERTRLSVGASRQENDPDASQWGGLPAWHADGTRTDWRRSATTAAKWASWASSHRTHFVRLEHQFDNGWKAELMLNHGENEGDLKLLYLYGTPDRSTGLGMGASPARYAVSRKQDDIGVHASGPFELLGRKHELAFGLMRSEQDFDATRRAAAGVSAVGNFNLWDGSYPEPAWGPETLSEAYETVQEAAYAVARLSLADPLKLIVGARVSNWTRDGQTPTARYEFDHKGVVTPYAGLIYDIDGQHSAYASYTDIFNPQNYRDRNGDYLDPLTGKSYEVGVKGEYFGGRLNASLAVFRIEQDNLAQTDAGYLVPGTSNQAYYAAQGTTSEGYEIEVAGEPAPGWKIAAGWTQFEAKDEDGDKVNTNHPRRMLKLFTTWQLPGAWEKLTVGGGINWEGENYTAVTNPVTGAAEKLKQRPYALVNLMARYQISKAVSAQLNVNNLFDKTYYSQIGFYNQLAYGAPRNAQLTLKYQF